MLGPQAWPVFALRSELSDENSCGAPTLLAGSSNVLQQTCVRHLVKVIRSTRSTSALFHFVVEDRVKSDVLHLRVPVGRCQPVVSEMFVSNRQMFNADSRPIPAIGNRQNSNTVGHRPGFIKEPPLHSAELRNRASFAANITWGATDIYD